MARPMFEYTKTVLIKVSFSPQLFCEEVKKASQRLLPYELEELYKWLMVYTKNHPELKHCMSYINVEA